MQKTTKTEYVALKRKKNSNFKKYNKTKSSVGTLFLLPEKVDYANSEQNLH